MVCIYCGSKLSVVNSRSQKRSHSTWRRRQCPQCKTTITTVERVDYPTAIVFKNTSGALTGLSRDQLFIDVYECLKHRKTALADATALTDTILSQLLTATQQAEISRRGLITLTTEVLKRFDHATAVQYAAYHPL